MSQQPTVSAIGIKSFILEAYPFYSTFLPREGEAWVERLVGVNLHQNPEIAFESSESSTRILHLQEVSQTFLNGYGIFGCHVVQRETNALGSRKGPL
jgi:hypothetical protein